MKILCIGDSLGLPRQGCDYEDTWIALLRKRYPEHLFIDHFAGDRLISSALHDYDTYYKYYNPDIVILQQGICDCAPRYLNDKSIITRIFRRMFYVLGLKGLFWRIVKTRNRNPNNVHTFPQRFVDIYKQLIDNILVNDKRNVVIIKVGHGSDSVIASSPYFNQNVDKYNSLIDEIASGNERVYIVNPLNNINDNMFVDGYHCGPSGMLNVYESLRLVLDKLLVSHL